MAAKFTGLWRSVAIVVATGSLVLGCAASSDSVGSGSGGSSTGGTAGPGASGSGQATGGATGSATGGTTSSATGGSAGVAGRTSTALPFTVDDFFVPSGFMGDGETPDNVIMLPDASPDSDKTCGGARALPAAVGVCHQVRYAKSGSMLWAGVFWQSPAGNWGDQLGYAIPSGATRVTFYAKGATGGEVVKFVAGIQGSLAHSDPFKIEHEFKLTAQWTGYSLDIGTTYNQVIGAFGWVASGDPAGVTLPMSFMIDHIRWE